MPASQAYFVYMVTNRSGTLYTGMTNDLEHRVSQHKNGTVPGFTSRYKLDKLLWFEDTHDVNAAIAREKQIKNWRRRWKVELIRKMNPNFVDLATGWGLGKDGSDERAV